MLATSAAKLFPNPPACTIISRTHTNETCFTAISATSISKRRQRFFKKSLLEVHITYDHLNIIKHKCDLCSKLTHEKVRLPKNKISTAAVRTLRG
ncbi:unnamed protein product [Leptidea sinapis]|uniref:Uncharacterized protein n=1 Tax=Leptidea sinapis TaxID=189913 RepID=A0A5E4QVW0_9NEOP|nr:unnamed protein product [Leptidea sinapis]